MRHREVEDRRPPKDVAQPEEKGESAEVLQQAVFLYLNAGGDGELSAMDAAGRALVQVVT